MVVDDDRNTRREQRVETGLVERMRVITGGREDEEVDDVDDASAESRAEGVLEEGGGGNDFCSQFESDADEDDVGVDS